MRFLSWTHSRASKSERVISIADCRMRIADWQSQFATLKLEMKKFANRFAMTEWIGDFRFENPQSAFCNPQS
jgi:hypothetical protein